MIWQYHSTLEERPSTKTEYQRNDGYVFCGRLSISLDDSSCIQMATSES